MSDAPELPELEKGEHQSREEDIDNVLEIYRTAKRLGRFGITLLYVVAAILGIALSIKKLFFNH